MREQVRQIVEQDAAFNSEKEMIFRCQSCKTPRQYGTALSLRDKPDNLTPVLRCASCKRATEHVFDSVQFRTISRQRKVDAECFRGGIL